VIHGNEKLAQKIGTRDGIVKKEGRKGGGEGGKEGRKDDGR
jgi:hypothetical protein